MFKKTRLRIVAVIMTVATVIIALMLSVIFVANSHYSYERGVSLLENYVDENMGKENNQRGDMEPVQFTPEQGLGKKFDRNKMYNLSTFYSVYYDADGNVDRVICGDGIIYTEDEILEIADNILASEKTSGEYNNMPFLVRKSDMGTIVALIDNTMEMDNSDSLLRNSFISGISGWFIILILSWFASKAIVAPLEKNDTKQKQFISDAGHELKTPISVISANADILSAEIGDNKWLSNIQYENERMGNLVKQLLELVRAEDMQQAKETLDFSRLVSGGALPFESVAFENGLSLNTEIADEIYVEGNRNQLSQLVSILIDNAISHGSEGKEVTVKLNSTKHHAAFSVVNAGQPIPEEVKSRLFERFYRADEARSEDAGHFGLGLAIAKAIVTAHGGKIEVDCHDSLIEFRAVIQKTSKN